MLFINSPLKHTHTFHYPSISLIIQLLKFHFVCGIRTLHLQRYQQLITISQEERTWGTPQRGSILIVIHS